MDSSLVPQQPSGLENGSLEVYSSRQLSFATLEGASSGDFNPRDYLVILLKRKWTIILSVVVVFSLVAIATLRMTRLYDAVARVALSQAAPQLFGPNGEAFISTDWDEYDVDTQIKILQSDTLALQVAKALGWDRQLPGRNTNTNQLASPFELTAAEQAALLGRVHSGLRIFAVPHTRVIEIHSMGPDPRVAAQIVNTLTAQYVEQNFKTKYQSAMQTSEWLSRQLADLQIKVETAQEKLVRYQRENGIVGVDEKQNVITSKLDELNRELTAAEADRIQKESQYRMAIAGAPETLSSQGGLLERLRGNEADLETQYSAALTQFGAAYPKVVQLKEQLDHVQRAIQAETEIVRERYRRDYLTSLEREKMFRAAFEQQTSQANELNQRAIEYSLLKRDVDSNRQLYDGLLQKLKEAGISAGLKSDNIRVVDSARVPLKPSKPDVPRNLAIGFIAGLLGGIVLAFIVEGLDNTVRTPDQMQVVSGLALLGVIPSARLKLRAERSNGHRDLGEKSASSDGGSGQLLVLDRPRSEVAESFRTLRTSILLSSSGGPPKVILFTSPLPQEGKTTAALNCSVVLAQKGARVLLIDADLRRPALHHAFSISNYNGLSTLLAGRIPFEQAIVQAPGVPNLHLIPSGPIPPNPAELLSSELMRQILQRCRREFDHIVIDTPPVISITDAAVLSPEADSCILIVRSGRTTRAALRRARNLLAFVNAKLSGAVLNAVDLRSADYQYYYGYYHNYYNEEAHQELAAGQN
jgi:succinoglycan biosynthesis transport protein ExoP